MTETQADEDVQAVLKKELVLLAPDANRADLEALLHPDFTEVAPNGRRWARSELITALTTATNPDPTPRTAVDLRAARLSGSPMLVTYVSEQGERRASRVTIWLLTGPSWRAYYHQSTPIPPGQRRRHPARPAATRSRLAGVLPPAPPHPARLAPPVSGPAGRRYPARLAPPAGAGHAAG